MKRKNIIVSLFILSLLALGTVLIIAEPPGGMGRNRPQGMGMKDCFKGMDLTPEQEAKLIDQRFAHQEEILPLKRDLAKKRLELKAELDKENPSTAVLDKITDDMAVLQGKMKKSNLHFILSLRSIMTKEQWQEAKEHLAERSEGGPGMGRGMGMQPGRGPCKSSVLSGDEPAAPPSPPSPPFPPPMDDDD